jgi:hypothetical protein
MSPPHQPPPPRPARPLKLCLESSPVGVQLGVTAGHGLQFIEHADDIPRHADLVRLGVVSLRPRFLQLGLQLGALLDQPHLIGLDPLQFGNMGSAEQVQRCLMIRPLFGHKPFHCRKMFAQSIDFTRLSILLDGCLDRVFNGCLNGCRTGTSASDRLVIYPHPHALIFIADLLTQFQAQS